MTVLAAAIAGALALAVAPSADASEELETIYVYGRVPVPEPRVAASVTSFDAASIAAELVGDARDLVRYAPGLNVRNDPHRFGLDSFAIRGLGGNRVAVEVDGMPAASGFAVGSYSDSGRSFVDTALIERVEILRGPASALYGSDAIAGVVSARTVDEARMLDGEAAALNLRSGYTSADQGWNAALLGAARLGGVDGFVGYVRREGHEVDSAAEDVEPNPRDFTSDALLLKFTAAEAPGGPLRLWLYAQQLEQQTAVESYLLNPGRFANTIELLGDDRQDLQRATVTQTLDQAGGLDRVDWGLYWQRTETRQDSLETRRAAPPRTPPLRIERGFELDSETFGLRTTAVLQRTTGGMRHDLVFGLDALRTDTRELRDGLQTNLLTGSSTSTVLGETYPVRDFPLTAESRVGVFVQDEVSIDGTRWSLIPALRVEHLRVDPRVDSIYREDVSTPPVGIEVTPVAPKLGVLYRLDERTTLFAQYAHGFRAPPPEDVNIGLEIPAFNVKAVPNPDLEPEKSDAFELGVRWSGESTSLSASAYLNEYRDFIESKVNLGPDPDTGTVLFQSQNVARARISGVEFAGEARLGEWSPGLEGWSARFALAWIEGRDEVRDVPLNSVDPASAVLRFGYEAVSGRWGGELATRLVAAKDDVAHGALELYETDSFATLDLLAHWVIAEGVRVDAGVFNLSDAEYIEWADVRGLAANDPLLPYYTRPGRNASVTLRWEFGGR
jgi:hemoglobin/transferrin/lactoferrin receptor protein